MIRRGDEGCGAGALSQQEAIVTKDEKQWIQDCVDCGCLVCRLFHSFGEVQAEYHHMLKNGRRMGHLFGFALCPSHHRGKLNGNNPLRIVSRDQNKRRFETRYAPEEYLLARQHEIVREYRKLNVGAA